MKIAPPFLLLAVPILSSCSAPQSPPVSAIPPTVTAAGATSIDASKLLKMSSQGGNRPEFSRFINLYAGKIRAANTRSDYSQIEAEMSSVFDEVKADLSAASSAGNNAVCADDDGMLAALDYLKLAIMRKKFPDGQSEKVEDNLNKAQAIFS